MAKSKTNNSAKTQTSSTSKRKASASNDGRSSAAKTPASPATPAITGEGIGHAAGEVWALLDRNGGQTLATIKKSVAAPADLVIAAIGWLAREDKIEFTTSGRTVKISLR